MGYLGDVVADAKGTYMTGGKQIPLEGEVLSPADVPGSDEISSEMMGPQSDDGEVTVEVPWAGEPPASGTAPGPVIRDHSGVQNPSSSHEDGGTVAESDGRAISPPEGMFDSHPREPGAAVIPDTVPSVPENQGPRGVGTSLNMPTISDEPDSQMDGAADNSDNFMTSELMGAEDVPFMDETEQAGDRIAFITSKTGEADAGDQRPDSLTHEPFALDVPSGEYHSDIFYEDNVLPMDDEIADHVNPALGRGLNRADRTDDERPATLEPVDSVYGRGRNRTDRTDDGPSTVEHADTAKDRGHRRAVGPEEKNPDVQTTAYRSTGTSPVEDRVSDTGDKKQEMNPSASATGQDDSGYQYRVARSVPAGKGALREDIPSVEPIRTDSRNMEALPEKGSKARTLNNALSQRERTESGKRHKDDVPARQRVKPLMQPAREHRGGFPDLMKEKNQDRHEGTASQNAPKVVIGNVDVVIETEKAPQTSERPARADSVGLSSRYYLRRL